MCTFGHLLKSVKGKGEVLGDKSKTTCWLVYAEKKFTGDTLGSSQNPQEAYRTRRKKWEAGQGEPVRVLLQVRSGEHIAIGAAPSTARL